MECENAGAPEPGVHVEDMREGVAEYVGIVRGDDMR
jgi:hypothetical protein